MPAINSKLTARALRRFVEVQSNQTGAKCLVLGLSGGLDSATMATLIATSEVDIPLRLYWLPYHTSEPENFEDAKMLAAHLECELQIIDIADVVDAARKIWLVNDNVRVGNLAARARMMALFDASAEHGGVVVGTSNLSEVCLGYGTLHGDMACAFNPLGRLFKTELRQVGPELGIPEKFLKKVPTADLWKGQTDELELGFSYEDADKVLYLYVRVGLNRKQIAEEVGDRALVDKVLDRTEKYKFKSQIAPVGPSPV